MLNTVTDDVALEAVELGKRYRRGWALRDCTFRLPVGRVSALVGPNGAGKSTLMALATALLAPTTGTIRVLGEQPGRRGTHRRLGFLAQSKPLYRTFTVAEMLRATRALNPGWDDGYARRLVEEAGVPLNARIDTLSGGQRTRVALALAFGTRPELIMLDEPLAELDPLARTEVMQTVLAEVAETGMTVLLSSHVMTDLEGVCDHLLLLAEGRVHVAGDVEDLLTEHRVMIGARSPGGHPFAPETVIEARHTQRQTTLLLRDTDAVAPPGWQALDPTLEELTLAYLRSASTVPAGHTKAVAA